MSLLLTVSFSIAAERFFAENVAADGFAALIPPTVYYARVGLELSKLVFQGQKMSPP